MTEEARMVAVRAATVAALEPWFGAPRPLSRPVPFWLLNGSAPLDRYEFERQLVEFHCQGFEVVCLIPVYDEADIYLRQPWWEMMRWICGKAKELGMEVWIGDECACPSGSVAMTLPQTPGFRSVGLQALRLTVRPGEALPPEDLLAAFAMPELRPIPREEWNGVWPGAAPAEVLLVKVGATPGRPGAHRLAQGFGRGEVNRLGAEAMARFVQETHDRYLESLPGEIGTTITGVFTDEPALFEPPGWVADLADEFQHRKGYDPLPHLAALFADAGPGTSRFRCDFHEVLAALYRERFFDLQRTWCEAHGLLYGGHLWQNWPWGLAAGVLWQPDPLRTLAAMAVPGVDWTAGAGKVPVSELKMASSAAHLAGRPRALIEAFAGLGPVYTFEQLKWMVHWMFAAGIDLLVLHAGYFRPDEGLAGIAHPSIFWQTPIWRHVGLFSDYVGRVSEMLQAGRHLAPVAVLYPTGAVWAETVYPEGVWPKPPDHALPPLPALERLRAQIEALAAFLTEHQIDFDFVDEEALLAAGVEGNSLRVGEESYRAVVLPHTATCRMETLRCLGAFLESGGRVVACGDLPVHSREAGCTDAAIVRAVAALRPAGLVEAGADWSPLAEALPRDLRVEPAAGLGPERNLYYQRRHLEDGELFFLASHSPRREQWRVWFRATGYPEQWDPEKGTRHGLPAGTPGADGTWLELGFEPYQAYAVVFRAEPEPGLPGLPGQLRPVGRVEGWWTVEFLPNEGNPYLQPHDHRYDLRERTIGPASALVPWWRFGLGGFSGAARYRCLFQTPERPHGRRLWLDLGRVEQAAAATLNGRSLGGRLWRPFRFEVTEALQTGENQLEVIVTNGLANFLSAARGAAPPLLTQAPVSAMWSGLLGPVSLLAEQEAEPTHRDS